MQTITENQFDSVVLKSTKPVLVDFYAPWCGPCKMLTPILEQVSAEANDKFEIVKINIDDCYNLAKKYGVMSVPTMIVFKDGEESEKVVGLRSKNDILKMMESHV